MLSFGRQFGARELVWVVGSSWTGEQCAVIRRGGLELVAGPAPRPSAPRHDETDGVFPGEGIWGWRRRRVCAQLSSPRVACGHNERRYTPMTQKVYINARRSTPMRAAARSAGSTPKSN
uniref:Uncharacterized protein n=1 Tax=Plectus sambesii TaxID=2011161 RepID=A0A914X4L8_9BILA